MAKQVALPFQGSFSHVQGFGSNPAAYAGYGILGHDGDDWLMPEGTKLYSPITGTILRATSDPAGWGFYIWVWDKAQGIIVNIAHMNGFAVTSGNTVSRGQQIGISGNSGNSSQPHVHVAVANVDSNGNRTEYNNGYHGWYSILDSSKVQLVSLTTTTTPTSGTTTTTTPTSGTTTTSMTFDQIYAAYYAGWDKTAALADFNNTYGGDLNRLLAARGISTGGSTTTVQTQIPSDDNRVFEVRRWERSSLDEFNSGAEGIYGRLDGNYYRTIYSVGELGTMQDANGNQLPGGNNFDNDQPVEYAAVGPYYAQLWQAYNFRDGIKGSINLNQTWRNGYGRVQSMVVYKMPPEPVIPPPTTPPESPPPSTTTTDLTPVTNKLDQISSKLDQVLAKLGTGGTTTSIPAPPAESATGLIFISSTPDRASIYIDGQFRYDYTPSNSPAQAAIGSHVVTLKKKGYKTYSQTVEVAAQDTIFVDATLEAVAP